METTEIAMLDIDMLRGWIGREQTAVGVIAPEPFERLAATLDREPAPLRPGDRIPIAGCWLLFTPTYRLSEAGPDGHAARGDFLPPVPLPRRMWAGGRIAVADTLRVGDRVTKTSRIKDVSAKSGRTGLLCFVLVEHLYETDRGPALREEHDIVYRVAPAGDAPATRYERAPDATWTRTVTPTDLLLFRYSALTFNGHRIHYDRRYVTEVEFYPGLVVHGPLQATLLLDLVAQEKPDARLSSFSFRAMKPVYDLAPFKVCGAPRAGGADLWIADQDGDLCMRATAEFSRE